MQSRFARTQVREGSHHLVPQAAIPGQLRALGQIADRQPFMWLTVPAVGSSRLISTWSSVVLPTPFDPTSAIFALRGISTVTR
jgi:hypothetical protein